MFEVNQQCVLEHVNVRRGKNDEAQVAVDIKFSCEELPGKAVAAAMRAVSMKEVDEAFFSEGKPRFLGLARELPTNCDFEGKHKIRISGGAGLNVSRLWKVKLTARKKGLYDVVFQVTVNPEKNDPFIERIADNLHRSVAVNLSQTQKELWDIDEDEKPPVEKKQGEMLTDRVVN